MEDKRVAYDNQVLYVSEEVSIFFNETVVEPLANSDMFNDFLPMRNVFLFYGRKGVGKEEMICQLLERNNIHYALHKFNPEKADLDYEHFETVVDQLLRPSKTPIVLVLSQVDALIMSAKTPRVQMQILKLKDKIKASPHMFLCLSNTPPAGLAGDAMQQAFYEQFDKRCFVKAPGPDFRIRYLRHLIEKQMKFVDTLSHVHLTCELDDSDYKWLSTVSAKCTLAQMYTWVQKLFYRVQRPNQDPVVITRTLLEDENNRLLTRATGSLSIVAEDCEQIERHFAQYAGLGIKVSVETIGNDNDEPVSTRVSAFQEKNADTKAAWEALDSVKEIKKEGGEEKKDRPQKKQKVEK